MNGFCGRSVNGIWLKSNSFGVPFSPVDHDVHGVQVDVVELRLVAQRVTRSARSSMKRGEMKSA